MRSKVFISIADAEVGLVVADPIFAVNERKLEVMLTGADTVLTERMIDRLKMHGVGKFTIFGDGYQFEDDYADKPGEDDKPQISKVESVVSDSLHKEAIQGIQCMFDLAGGSSVVTAYQVVKELNNVVDQLVETVSSEKKDELVHIANLKSYDEYTYNHSLSVALLSIAIGQQLSFSAHELQQLGRCAIMHDIGKIMSPIEIINKPTKLTPEEYEIIKSHSENGGKYLKSENIGDDLIWEVVSGHHEKIDGTGYSKGIKGNDIHIYSRITTVADVYDALTSYRSYRTPMAPPMALERILGDAGRAFDYDVVHAFRRKIDLYPINTILELSNKRIGVVVDNCNSMRPTLRMLDDSKLLDLADLRNLSIMIERVVDARSIG